MHKHLLKYAHIKPNAQILRNIHTKIFSFYSVEYHKATKLRFLVINLVKVHDIVTTTTDKNGSI